MRVLALALAFVLAGCDGTVEPAVDVPDPEIVDLQAAKTQKANPFIGSWMLTLFAGPEGEVPLGDYFRYVVTLRSDSTHSVSVSNDVEHWVCKVPPQTSCQWDGTYTYTPSTITFYEPNHPDPGQGPEDTALYAFCGGSWFLLDDPNDGGVRITFQRTGPRRPTSPARPN